MRGITGRRVQAESFESDGSDQVLLQNLSGEELRAIFRWGEPKLAAWPGAFEIWKRFIRNATHRSAPVFRQWILSPYYFAGWLNGGNIEYVIPSRGFVPLNLVRFEGPAPAPADVQRRKREYESRFRHNPPRPQRILGLEDIGFEPGEIPSLQEPSGEKPWAGFPGGEKAYVRSLLRQTAAGDSPIGQIQEYLNSTEPC